MAFEQAFREHASQFGLTLPERIQFDGKIHRFRPADGSNRGDAGWYVGHAEGEIAWGSIGDWTQDLKESWFSGKRITREIRKKIEKSYKEAEKIAAKKAAACAEEATKLWETSELATPDHPYLTAKKIQQHGARQKQDDLIIPVYNQAGLASVQTIAPDGSKKFLPGSPMRGAWSTIGEPTPTIILAEGWATGATLYEATGHMVYIGFNAGNLPFVAATIREMHPEAEIIVAADQDAWEKDQNILRPHAKNIGQVKAAEAAAVCGGTVKTIPVSQDLMPDGKHPTDFNDWSTLKSLESITEIFFTTEDTVRVTAVPIKNVTCIDGKPFYRDWRSSFLVGEDGNIKTTSFANAALVFENDPELKEVFRYNELSKKPFVLKNMPWEKNSSPRPLYDIDEINATIWLEREYGISQQVGALHHIIQTVSDKNKYNPVVDYLEGLKWDKIERLPMMLVDLLGVEDSIYSRLVGKRFMVGAVARAYVPGCKMDNILVLEGAQGRHQKSTFIEKLFGKEFYGDTILDIGSKDTMMMVTQKWCFEIPELDALEKKNSSEIKAWLSRKTEEFRVVWGRNISVVPRPCVFVGTTNEKDYLKDSTGGRRYWPVACKEFGHEKLTDIRDQLWAEAVHFYKAGERWWLKNEEEDEAEKEQEIRLSMDAWNEIVIEYVGLLETTNTEDILQNCINMPKEKWNKAAQMRISSILRSNGWSRRRINRKYVYIRSI